MNKRNTNNTETTFDSVETGKLFILPNVGVCRKTSAMLAQDKAKQVRVVYPKDTVSLLNHNKK